MKLIVHAGIHRTGTTHLQKTLSHNRQLLRRHGYLYPFDRPSHQWLVRKILNNPKYADRLPKDLKRQISAGDHTVILSGEDFSSLPDVRWLEVLSKHFDVRILVYVRRQDLWLNSWYNQIIKWPWTDEQAHITPEMIVETLPQYHWLDYLALLDSWSTIVPENHITVVPFEGDAISSIVKNFERNSPLGQDLSLPEVRASSNASVCAQTLEIIRYFNLNQLKPWARNNVIWHTQQKVQELYGSLPTMVFSPEERRAILRNFRRSNSEVARRYLGRVRARRRALPQSALTRWRNGSPGIRGANTPAISRRHWLVHGRQGTRINQGDGSGSVKIP
jgi:hypothetical protein